MRGVLKQREVLSVSNNARPLTIQTSSLGGGWFSQIKRPVLWAAIAMIAAIYLRGILMGKFGKIGVDDDDVMRLVQIKDYLAGQSWFNTDQMRLGVLGGTDMHWSRLVDFPIILLTHFFDIFMAQDKALMLAISIWPPLTAAIIIFAIAKAAKYYAALSLNLSLKQEPLASFKTAQTFTLILLGFFVVPFFRFEPGAIDHHNIQLGLVALAMAGAMDPKGRFKTHFVSGVAIAVSVAIGTEVYIFAGVICAYIALNFLLRGDKARRSAQGFGLGLSAALAAAFFGTLMPTEYLSVKCDSLSLITLSAGLAGGLGLALAAHFVSHKSMTWRLMAGAVIGAMCLFIFALQGPQCLSNPLSKIPDDVKRLWLDEVQEARPIWKLSTDWLAVIPLTLGPALLGLAVLGRQLKKDAQWSPRWLILMLLVAATLLSLYQVRFNIFSYIFALLPLAAWTAELYTRGKAKAEGTENTSNIAYIGGLALSIPLIWGFPAVIAQSFEPSSQSATELSATQMSKCYSDTVMEALNTLPTGTIASTSNGGARILLKTKHRALSGNYHRNIKGITAQIHLATSSPQKSYDIMANAGVEYVHFCNPSPETQNLAKENAEGLYVRLLEQDIPRYLMPVLTLENGGVIIYKVNDTDT